MTLQRGHAVPFFEVDAAGVRRAYEDLWQRRALLLVSLAPPAADAAQIADLLRERIGAGAEVIVTGDEIDGMPRPGVLVADRWGEIVHVAPLGAAGVDGDDLAAWVRFVEIKCPECEGEAR